MKEVVVIIGTVILGVIIFNMIAGDGNSLKNAGRDYMEHVVRIYEDF